jgi:hypothetical protein
MEKVIKYILEEIIDPLAVKYLLSRRNSEPWDGGYGEEKVIKELEHYRTPRQHRNGHQVLIRGEELFRELHEEIRAKHPEDGVAAIDTITKEWKYAPCIADAEKAVAEMKNPRAIYFRPCNV